MIARLGPLTHRRVLVGLGALALLVHLPALAAPYVLDDHVQAAMVDGTFPVHRSPFDLYDFVDDGDRRVLLDRGIIPWWTHPQLTVRFLRPLSSALLWVDYQLFGRNASAAHAHSLLWWALASATVYVLLRRTLGRRVALLGGAAFAFSPCHAIPLVWVANREALVSTALGTLGLLAHLRWREGRRARDALAASALFALAMLSGEYTVCFGGYVLAIELVRSRETLLRRATGMIPFLVPALAYLAARAHLGYRAVGSGFYRDPLSSFGPFLAGAPRRIVVLLADAWLTMDADTGWSSTSPWWLAVIFVVGLGLSFVPIRRAIAALDEPRRAHATWLLWGSLLAMVPLLAVQPSVRLMGIPCVGACAVVGVLLEHSWFPSEPARAPARRGVAELTAIVAVGLGFAHLVRAPVCQWLLMRTTSFIEDVYDDRIAWLRKRAPDLPSTRVVVVRADSAQTMLFAPFMFDESRGVPPARWWVLSFESRRALLLRIGPSTLDLVASTPSPLFPVGPNDLFRNEEVPVHVGDAMQVPGLRATILETSDDGGPRRVRFDFDRDVDDPSFWFLAEGDTGFKEVVVPRVGMGAPVAR
jgi:hypothetical protein